MHTFTSLLVLGSLAVQAVLCLPDPSRVKERDAELMKRSLDTFIATESPIALSDLLCNIGAAGACASGASSGIVIASPDRYANSLFLILLCEEASLLASVHNRTY